MKERTVDRSFCEDCRVHLSEEDMKSVCAHYMDNYVLEDKTSTEGCTEKLPLQSPDEIDRGYCYKCTTYLREKKYNDPLGRTRLTCNHVLMDFIMKGKSSTTGCPYREIK